MPNTVMPHTRHAILATASKYVCESTLTVLLFVSRRFLIVNTELAKTACQLELQQAGLY